MNESKQYDIPKRAVIEAYKRVKANRGSAGIDGVDFEIFEKRLNNNLYKIWNRMSSGSYIPSPVMAVEIPKKTGGVRRLGIPTITDRVAQMVARMYVERAVDPIFCEDHEPGETQEQVCADLCEVIQDAGNERADETGDKRPDVQDRYKDHYPAKRDEPCPPQD